MSDPGDASAPDAVRERVAEWIRSAPRGRDGVVEDVERFRNTTAQERTDALRALLAAAQAMAGDRLVRNPLDDDELWRRWLDTGRGRPR